MHNQNTANIRTEIEPYSGGSGDDEGFEHEAPRVSHDVFLQLLVLRILVLRGDERGCEDKREKAREIMLLLQSLMIQRQGSGKDSSRRDASTWTASVRVTAQPRLETRQLKSCVLIHKQS